MIQSWVRTDICHPVQVRDRLSGDGSGKYWRNRTGRFVSDVRVRRISLAANRTPGDSAVRPGSGNVVVRMASRTYCRPSECQMITSGRRAETRQCVALRNTGIALSPWSFTGGARAARRPDLPLVDGGVSPPRMRRVNFNSYSPLRPSPPRLMKSRNVIILLYDRGGRSRSFQRLAK